VHNFPIVDNDVPAFEYCLEIVKCMHKYIAPSNDDATPSAVLIHCHAGWGRTGFTIACYLLYSKQVKNAQEAILLVQKKRKRALQNKAQQEFVKQFEKYLLSI